MIYHITSEESWSRAQEAGEYIDSRYRDSGFIHCSQKNQLKDVIAHNFKNIKGLVVLEIDEQKLTSPLKTDNIC